MNIDTMVHSVFNMVIANWYVATLGKRFRRRTRVVSGYKLITADSIRLWSDINEVRTWQILFSSKSWDSTRKKCFPDIGEARMIFYEIDKTRAKADVSYYTNYAKLWKPKGIWNCDEQTFFNANIILFCRNSKIWNRRLHVHIQGKKMRIFIRSENCTEKEILLDTFD